MRLYRKKNCEFCQLADSFQSFRINDRFYWRLCKEHNVPIIIYKYHNKPTDKEIQEVLVWAKRKFPYLTPNFQRKHVPEHYSIELEFKTKIEVKMEETLVTCSNCQSVISIGEAIQIGDKLYCIPCAELNLGLVQENIDHELYQIIDEDDYEEN